MVLPCAETFGPSRLAWTARIGTTTSADFSKHDSGFPDRPTFRASSTRRYAFEISPDKGLLQAGANRDLSPPKFPIYQHSVFQFGFALGSTLTWSYRPCMRFLYVTWRVLVRMWLKTNCQRRLSDSVIVEPHGSSSGIQLYEHIRRLPPHGLSPPRSCPHLVLISYELFIWYDDSLIEMTGTKHRGLAPHKITPMLGVLHTEDSKTCFGNGCLSARPR